MWSPLHTLLFRVDRAALGPSDNLLRCLALAQAWVDSGGRAVFVQTCVDPLFDARLTAEDIESVLIAPAPGSVEDAQLTAELAEEWDADWVVICGPQFDRDYQRIVREAGIRLLLVSDDGLADHCEADMILNQTLFAEESLYPNLDRHVQLLLGPRYALLRRDFVRWAHWQRSIPEVAQHVLIAFPGMNRNLAAIRSMNSLARVDAPGLEAIVVSPPSTAHYPRLQTAALQTPMRVRLRPNITAMPGLVSWSDIAMTSGEVPPYEWMLMGLPSLFVTLSAEERPVAERLAALQLGVILGNVRSLEAPGITKRLKHILGSWQDREAMARASRQLVDSQGAERVRMRLCGDSVRLRKSTADDCDLLWQWTNDPSVRENSFTHEPISWDAHVQWFTNKLQDPRSHLFIGVDLADVPVGRVRFDVTGRAAQISLAVAKDSRGKGYGGYMIDQGSALMFRHTWVTEIHAFIKPANAASLRLFQKSGFTKVGDQVVNGQESMHYVLSRNRVIEMSMHRIVPK